MESCDTNRKVSYFRGSPGLCFDMKVFWNGGTSIAGLWWKLLLIRMIWGYPHDLGNLHIVVFPTSHNPGAVDLLSPFFNAAGDFGAPTSHFSSCSVFGYKDVRWHLYMILKCSIHIIHIRQFMMWGYRDMNLYILWWCHPQQCFAIDWLVWANMLRKPCFFFTSSIELPCSVCLIFGWYDIEYTPRRIPCNPLTNPCLSFCLVEIILWIYIYIYISIYYVNMYICNANASVLFYLKHDKLPKRMW